MFKILDKYLEEVLLVILLSLMSILIGTQVFMRYVMGNSLTWSEELARYCFIWATYIGVSYGVKCNAHISVTVISDLFPKKTQHFLKIFAYIIFGVFAILVMKEGWQLAMKIFNFNQRSSSLGIPMGWIYLAPTTSFALVLLRLIQQIVAEVGILRSKEY